MIHCHYLPRIDIEIRIEVIEELRKGVGGCEAVNLRSAGVGTGRWWSPCEGFVKESVNGLLGEISVHHPACKFKLVSTLEWLPDILEAVSPVCLINTND